MGALQQLHTFHIPFDAEQFQKNHADCPNDIQLLKELWQKITPAIYWREEEISSNDGDILILGDQALSIASCYVCKGLAQCRKATVMALTIGSGLPNEARYAAQAGQLYRSVVADYLGSHGVELLAEAFCQYLQQQAFSRGMYATLRYSPGYGDWALAAQPELFSFLNQCNGNITLSENYLMEPVKSITAIIGWSSQWQKQAYPQGEHNAFCNGGHNCAACVTWACRKG